MHFYKKTFANKIIRLFLNIDTNLLKHFYYIYKDNK